MPTNHQTSVWVSRQPQEPAVGSPAPRTLIVDISERGPGMTRGPSQARTTGGASGNCVFFVSFQSSVFTESEDDRDALAPSCLALRPHGRQPARLVCPRDSPGENTGVGCMPSSRGSSRPRIEPTTSGMSQLSLALGCEGRGSSLRSLSCLLHFPRFHFGQGETQCFCPWCDAEDTRRTSFYTSHR